LITDQRLAGLVRDMHAIHRDSLVTFALS